MCVVFAFIILFSFFFLMHQSVSIFRLDICNVIGLESAVNFHECQVLNNFGDTVEYILRDHPIGHKTVVSQDNWSLVTGSSCIDIQCIGLARNTCMWTFKTGSLSLSSGLSTQVPLQSTLISLNKAHQNFCFCESCPQNKIMLNFKPLGIYNLLNYVFHHQISWIKMWRFETWSVFQKHVE